MNDTTTVRSAAHGDFGGAAPAVLQGARIADVVIQWTLLVLAAAMPVFFLPWTVEVLELNKQLLLFAGTALVGVAWIGKMLVERRLEYRRSHVNSFVVLYVAVYGASAWMSQSRHLSLIGDFGQEMSGFFTVLALAILYFVVASNIRTVDHLHRLFSAFMLGGFLSAAFGLLQGLGVHVLPFEFAKTAAFNSVGTVAGMGMYLAFVVSLISGVLLMGHRRSAADRKSMFVRNALMAFTAAVSLLLVAVIDFWPVSLALFFASLVLIAFAFVHARSMRGIGGVILPIVALIVSLFLLIVRMPLSFGYPAEVMPSMRASWDIALQTLHERPLLGSGPGTFILDYAKYRSPEVNLSQFWNIRFDRGASHVLTSFASTGYLGTLSWLILVLYLLGISVRSLLSADEKAWHTMVSIFSAWFLLVLGRLLYSSTITLEFVFWTTTALLVIVLHKEWYSVKFENSPRAAMALSFLFILAVVFSLSGLFAQGQRYASEVYYARAIENDRVGGKVDDTLANFAAAANLNRNNDVIIRNGAQALLMKANELLSTPLDLQKEDGESEADFKTRQEAAAGDRIREATAATAEAVNAAMRATEVDPANVENWAALAAIYQGLMGITDGADGWAVTTLEKAISLEPSNPALHTELGKVYLWQADQQAQLAAGEDMKAEDVDAAKKKSEELVQKAVDTFAKATELKGDYAPAYYHQGLAYERQGKTADAISRLEAVATLSPQDVGIGFQLALLYFQNERKDDAIRLMESVVRLSPKYSNALWYLAAMYEDKGDFDKAIEMVTRVRELNPEEDMVAQKLAELAGKAVQPPEEGEEVLPEPVE